MRQLVILSGFLLLLTNILFSQTKKTVAVGFYNLENYYDTLNDPLRNDDEFTPNGANAYTPAVFLKKIENLSTVIAMMAKDKTDDGLALFGVAEIENMAVLKALCQSQKLKSRNYKIVHFDGPDERGIDCGLIYNPLLFKVLQAASLTVPVEEGDRPTRDVLYVTGILQGDTVHVFVNHWPSRRGGESATREKRKIAAGVSKKVIDSLMKINPNTKVIDMGDLNDDPINKSITEVLQAKGNVKDVPVGGMYNPWLSFYKKGLGTMAYQDTWGLFDQILMSYGFINDQSNGLHFVENEVFNRSFMIEKFGQYKGYPKRSYSNGTWNDGYSDHYPTIIYLK
jgi:Endonuclease/Exonuclease/phosphatase family